MNSDYDAILFDFDYTLADSSRGAAACIDYALQAMGLARVSYEQACRTIGLSLPETLVRLAGESQRPRGEEFARLFVRRADEVMADLTTLLAGVPAVMAELHEVGLHLGIVSTKFRRRIALTLARDGLADLFDVVIGGEDVVQPKPEPEALLKALAGLGVPAARCLYVGDSVTDAEAARRAGLAFVAVLTGTTLQADFAGYPVRALLPDLSKLPALLALGGEEPAP